MKLTMTKLHLAVVLLSIPYCQAATVPTEPQDVSHDDESFWNRFLRKDSSLSVPPPEVACDVDVKLNCKLSDGRSCDNIQPPRNAECAVGSEIRTIALRLLSIDCGGSNNDQEDATTCEDFAPINFSEEASVSCQGGEGEDLSIEPTVVAPGGVFTVTGSNGGVLPEKVVCMVSDSDGNDLQQTVIDTSGSVQLDLNNVFGALRLESCDRDGDELSCLETLNYEAILENVGTVDMDVTVTDFTFNDQTTSFLDDLEQKSLRPGQSTTLDVSFDVNACNAGTFSAGIDVEADPPNGDGCQDSDEYTIEVSPLPTRPPQSPPVPPPTLPAVPPPTLPAVPPPTPPPVLPATAPPTPEPQVACEVEVEIACTTDGGRLCEELAGAPDVVCSTGEAVEFATFSFNDRSCGESSNKQGGEAFCEDNVPITFSNPVTVACRDGDGGALTVEPSSVAPLGFFTVSSPTQGSLPSKIDCILLDTDGSTLQQNVIDTSGTVQLDLKDAFGALTLESCADTKSCIATLIYDVTMNNIGTVDMDITVADFSFGGQTLDLLGELEVNPLAPDESTSIQQQFQIDSCSGIEVSALVNVEADPPNGDQCQDTNELTFSVCPLPPTPLPPTPLPPTPVIPPVVPPVAPPVPVPPPTSPAGDCLVDATLTCLTSDGRDCDTIAPPESRTCSLGSPINAVSFSYQDCDCNCGSNSQGDADRCEDFAALVEEAVTVQCITSDGTALSVDPSPVLPGGTFTVSAVGGGSLPEKTGCTIIAPDGTQLQQVVIDTSGNVPLVLGEKFGALFLEACGALSCVGRLTYTIDVTNIGEVPMLVDVVNFDLNGNLFNLLEDLEINPLTPGQSTSLDQTFEVNVCNGVESTAQLNVEANPPNGNQCQDSDEYSFSVSPLPPAPATPPVPPPAPPPIVPPVSPPVPTPVSPPVPPPVESPPTSPAGDCDVEVTLICRTSDGRPCDTAPACVGEDCPSIGPPETTICSDGTPVNAIALSYQNCDCNCGSNGQGDADSCQDLAPLVEEPVTIQCISSDGSALTVQPTPVIPGGTFAVSAPGGGSLPDQTGCTIIAPDGTQLQQVVINTSGNVPLEIGDKFGALWLEGCDDLSCVGRLVYTIEVANTGEVPLLINALDFTVNGNLVNLLEDVETNPLSPGQVTNLDQTFEANVCRGLDSTALASVEASPPNGNQCEDTDEFSFSVPALPPQAEPAPPAAGVVAPPVPTPVGAPPTAPAAGDCVVEASVVCATSDGRDCGTIAPPTTRTCSEGDVNVIALSYQNCDCNCGSNGQGDADSCQDLAALVEEPVTVQCVSSDGTQITVQPMPVVPGGTFTVSAPGGASLPDKTGCTIIAPDGSQLQQVVIDTSGTVPLVIGDKFGALFLEGCDELSCVGQLVYTVDVANTGDVPLRIDVLDLIVNGASVSLLPSVETNPLNPGQATDLDRTFEANICDGIDITAQVNVGASPPNGAQCQNTAVLTP